MNKKIILSLLEKKLIKNIFLFIFLLYLCTRNWFAATSCRRRHGGCVVIKRESGEKPGQSRCCKRLIAASNMVTDIFSGRPLAMSFASSVRLSRRTIISENNHLGERNLQRRCWEDASQKTCRCHRKRKFR